MRVSETEKGSRAGAVGRKNQVSELAAKGELGKHTQERHYLYLQKQVRKPMRRGQEDGLHEDEMMDEWPLFSPSLLRSN